MEKQDEQSIRMGGIEVSTSGIKPFIGNLATLVKAEDIQEITIRHGFRSHHPLMQIVFGAVLSLLLIEIVKDIYRWLAHGGVMLDAVLLLVIPGGLGVYLILDGISRGYFLSIQTPRGRSKIAFDKGTKLEAVSEFAEALRQRRYKVVADYQ